MESRRSHSGVTEERQEACGSVDGVTMAIRSWETVGHSKLARAEQKSRVTVGNYSLIIVNRSNNHSVQLFLDPHFNNSHHTLPSPSLIKKTPHSNSPFPLRLIIDSQTSHSHPNSFLCNSSFTVNSRPLPPSTPPFPLQPTPFPLQPHLPIPFQSPHPVKYPITHLTPRFQPMSHPLPVPNCPTPSRDPSPPVTPPASPSSCSAVAPVLSSGSPSCRRTSVRQAARWLSNNICSRSASSASAERSRRDVSRRPVQREADRQNRPADGAGRGSDTEVQR